MKINLGLYAYENLNDDNSNTKYNYELPSVQFSNFFKKFDQNINISSSFLTSNKGGDSNQVHFNNSINFFIVMNT